MYKWLRYLTITAAGVALLTAGLVAVAPRSLQAADVPADPARSITVTGRAVAEVRPDTARLTFGVGFLMPTASDAYARMAQSMGDVVAAMKQLGVAEADMQTANLSLNAEYQWDKDNQQHLTGYRASSNIIVTTRRLDGLGAMIDNAVNAGANSLSGIEFFVGDSDAVSRDVLDKAADDARAKASRVAARLGCVVTSVTRVQVLDDSPPPPRVFAAPTAMAGAGAAMPVLSGTSRFQATVSVEFSLADAPKPNP